MQLLIDGYNLLHVTGVFADTTGPQSLERLHAVFLDFLAGLLGREQAERTTVVFDAKGRRATVRRTIHYAGITVHYADRHETADAYMVELLRSHHSPRQVLVVSSDHAVQRAARRRRAKVIDSDAWFGGLKRRPASSPDARWSEVRTGANLSPHEAAWWLSQFGDDGWADLSDVSPAPTSVESSSQPPSQSPSQSPPPSGAVPPTPRPAKPAAVVHRRNSDPPFPPEYLAQIAEEIQRRAPPQPHLKTRRARRARP